MISLSFFFLSIFSHYVLCQQFPILFYILFLFSILLQLFLGHNFGLPRLHFTSTFWASVFCQFNISHSFHMTSSCSPHQFLVSIFHHSNLYFHLIHSSLISSFNSHNYSNQVVLSQTSAFSCLFSVMPSSQVHSCIPRQHTSEAPFL